METAVLRVGIVSDIDPETGCVRVLFPDIGNMVSDWLPVLAMGFKGLKISALPDIGEHVWTGCLQNGSQNRVVFGAYPTADHTAPKGARPGLIIVDFLDGSRIEYDRISGCFSGVIDNTVYIECLELLAKVRASAVVNAGDHIEVSAPSIQVYGNVHINGDLVVDGNITNTGNMSTAGTHVDGIGKHYPD